MGHSRDIGSEHDIELYMDVDRFVLVSHTFGHMVHIPQVGGMIDHMCENRMGGGSRKFVHRKLGLGNIGCS